MGGCAAIVENRDGIPIDLAIEKIQDRLFDSITVIVVNNQYLD
jgi:hypothetical protein